MPLMNYPQNPATHPEFIPSTPVIPANRINILPTSGSMPFNNPLPNNPAATIQRAIDAGDTTEKRIRQFQESAIEQK